MLWHPPVPARVSSRRGGWGQNTVALLVSQSTWIGLLPTVQLQGKRKQCCSPVLLVLRSFLSLWRALAVPQSSLGGRALLLCRSYSVGLHCLRRSCSQYRCTFGVFLGDASSVSSQAAILDPPQNVTFLPKSSRRVLLHVLVNARAHRQQQFHEIIVDYEQEVCVQCWKKRLDLRCWTYCWLCVV